MHSPHSSLLHAVRFAALAHATHTEDDAGATPYINHPIAVAWLLEHVAGIDDRVTLQAALLHDAIEKGATTHVAIANRFGAEVADIVGELTDDPSLDEPERRAAQVAHASALSARAKLIKVADKLANAERMVMRPPPDWTARQREDYLRWGEAVVSALRGTSEPLEVRFDEWLKRGRAEIR